MSITHSLLFQSLPQVLSSLHQTGQKIVQVAKGERTK